MKMMERTEESRMQQLRDQIIFKSLVLKNDTKLNETDASFIETIEDEDGYILSMVKWERDNNSIPTETTTVVSLNETTKVPLLHETTTIAQLNRFQQEEEDSYILSMVKSILESGKLIETTTVLSLNETKTVSSSEDQPEDEDKYILSMVLNFSDDEKRQMLPERN